MHRQTPLGAGFRAWTAGGGRTVVTSVNDKTLMQSMGGTVNKGEQTSQKVEAPQNYGFSSVVHDAEKDGDGKVTGSAEGFIQYMGGNRSFPVCSVMDDRRHRLKELDAGDVAMFRGKDDQLQLHLSSDGGFWTGRNDKVLRLQLVAQEQQQGGGAKGKAADASGSSGGGQQQKATGQTAQRKKDSSQYMEVNGSMTVGMNKRHQTILDDKETGIEVHPNKNVYLGKLLEKGQFLQVMLADGSIAKNVYGLKADGRSADGRESPVQVLQREVAELRARLEALEGKVI